MPLSKAHKARTRERILDAAAARFRAAGYGGASVDQIMADAGLTRGGFYAHFASKAALFRAVLASRHDLLQRLAQRRGGGRALKSAGRDILRAYVEPRNAAAVAPNCTLANLAVDAARGGAAARRVLTSTVEQLAAEIERGEDAGRRPQALAALALAVGAVTLARGCAGAPLPAEILAAAHAVLDRVLDTPSGPPSAAVAME